MKPICFYHNADLDGVCSAAIVKHFMPDCELYGLDYKDAFPWDKVRPGPDAENDPLWAGYFKPENGYVGPEQNDGCAVETVSWTKRLVYMVDVSLKPDDMKRLAEVSKLVWIDHHETALDACEDLQADGVRGTEDAACVLTWEWFDTISSCLSILSEGEDPKPAEVPEAVRLLGAYDIWKKDDPEWKSKILPFQYGMRQQGQDTYDPNSLFWAGVVTPGIWSSKDVQARVEWGSMILSYQAEANRKTMEAGAHEIVIDIGGGHVGREVFRAIACNTAVFNSQFFDGFYDPEKHDIMCAYAQVYTRSKVYRGDLGAKLQWKVSLYSTKDDVDCGAIAKAFGGGGHKGAAGFICDKLPWEAK